MLCCITVMCGLLIVGELQFTVTADDLMRFDPTRLEAKAGDTVVVTFQNTGKLKNHRHNWVLLRSGENVDRVGKAAGPQGEITDAVKEKIVAAGKMCGAGEKTTIRFTAPSPGTYTFICTWPGHHSLSRGVLTVR